jgi:L-rhamnose mutarotase
MERVCFRLHVRAEMIEAYTEAHRSVWPEMRAALAASGWRNYSLFLADDGLLVGYLECDSLDEAKAAMAATEVNARWQAAMAAYFDGLDGGAPDEGIVPLPEIFHLD